MTCRLMRHIQICSLPDQGTWLDLVNNLLYEGQCDRSN